MNLDFLTDRVRPPGGYHAVEIAFEYHFDCWTDKVYWHTLDRQFKGEFRTNGRDTDLKGFNAFRWVVEVIACNYLDFPTVKRMHFSDIRVPSPHKLWIRYTDEDGDDRRDLNMFISACTHIHNYYGTSKEDTKMPVHHDMKLDTLFYSLKEFDLKIKNVIFNDPATIVFWNDGTKTVVKCHGDDIFDPEKGLAMAVSKKVFGNNYKAYGRFKKWLPKKTKTEDMTVPNISTSINAATKAINELGERIHKALEGK